MSDGYTWATAEGGGTLTGPIGGFSAMILLTGTALAGLRAAVSS